MPRVSLTDRLRGEYQELFDSCQVAPAKAREVDRLCDTLCGNKARYEAVGKPLGIPWQVIAVIHNMESSQSFKRHLHNGDPLTDRTRQVPAGRPKEGEPPFTWEESATDALILEGLDQRGDWSVPCLLYELEGYNGWGYRLHHPEVKSPYLWSGSNHYTSGKYVKDGVWSHTAVSAQVGAAVLLRRLAERREFEPDSAKAETAMLRYAPNAVTPGGAELQRFLNGFPGVFLKEDGKLGPRTSDACKAVLGHYLVGDRRA